MFSPSKLRVLVEKSLLLLFVDLRCSSIVKLVYSESDDLLGLTQLISFGMLFLWSTPRAGNFLGVNRNNGRKKKKRTYSR